MAIENENLFRKMSSAHYGDNLRKRTLFLPKILEEKSTINKQIFENGKFEKAYQIICKWADIEKSGKIKPRKESNLEGEYFKEIFGDCLGYALFSEHKDRWEAEQKYAINGAQADGVLGSFSQYHKSVNAVVELKGPTTNVDRDKSNGRTPVQQCWDYLNLLPECPWGIVCNFVSIRLYHRNFTPKAYELFTLQELSFKENFQKFYYIFQRDGILTSALKQIPRAIDLLEKSTSREKEVGENLYKDYHENRIKLIDHLITYHDKSLEKAIYIAQKLIDRVVFIAFCEDRGLLPPSSLKKAWEQIPPFSKIVNPRWQNFLELFHSIDKGNSNADISPYNGGLFRKDDEVDNLQLDDKETNFFKSLGDYDFGGEINVEVLGHLFERSVHDVERIKSGDFFGEDVKPDEQVKMSKSAERKRFGIYYTPTDFTDFITYKTINKLAVQRFDSLAKTMGISRDEAETAENNSMAREYWKKCFEILQDIKIVDPACGSGAFLIKAYDLFEDLYKEVLHHLSYQGENTETLRESIPGLILQKNIHGVDLSIEAVEITQLALWLRSAQKGKSLAILSENIVCGNSLIDDPNVHSDAFNWQKAFPNIFNRSNGGFDCVIGNPPWDRMKLQEREFFDGRDSRIATAVSAAKRRELISKLEKRNPELFKLYQNTQDQAEKNLNYVRTSGRYPLTGKGDINTYAVFAELAYSIVANDGLVGFLVPSGIATDNTTKDFFGTLINEKRLYGLFDFENKAPVFTDVHRSFKFSVILFGGQKQVSEDIEFVFFARSMSELNDKNRQISLSPDDIKILNPNTQTCPIFRTKRDSEIVKVVYKRVPVLVDKKRKKGGNPWGIKFFTMFHQTNDAELFHTEDEMKSKKYNKEGNIWKKGKKVFLPLYEAKMIQMYDHRAASVVINDENWMRQGQPSSASLVQHQNPEYTGTPRWWIDSVSVYNSLKENIKPGYIAFKDVTSPTNRRTMIASFIPLVGILNSAPLMFTGNDISLKKECCLLANINSFSYDFIARQKVGGLHLNYFIIEQTPVFSPDFYNSICPWNKKQTLEQWISERVLKLSCTSNDMIPLAEAAGFKQKVHKWKNDERRKLMAELDAAYFLFYNTERVDIIYILSTFSGISNQKESIFTDETSKLIIESYDSFVENMKSV
ncbi:MAG: N-6 DNA methylase [Sedimentisphaerales bacterium]|nr:N-6 DNA methylase [Sedimentisphaerales bacterium]